MAGWPKVRFLLFSPFLTRRPTAVGTIDMPVSKFDEKLATYEAALQKTDKEMDKDLLRKVTKGLGPSIYNSDSNKVACSDKAELQRVVDNFCMKKLGMTDKEKAMDAVRAVCKKYVDRSKHRAVFYYLVVKEAGMESHYA
jgi:hypothetical protein